MARIWTREKFRKVELGRLKRMQPEKIKEIMLKHAIKVKSLAYDPYRYRSYMDDSLYYSITSNDDKYFEKEIKKIYDLARDLPYKIQDKIIERLDEIVNLRKTYKLKLAAPCQKQKQKGNHDEN